MNIALIGYGKMGREVESIALQRGHRIVLRVDKENPEDLQRLREHGSDVAIEFSIPSQAFDNLKACLDQGIPAVSGTTGWDGRKEEISRYCLEKQGALFLASNFSIGVHLLFHLNRELASLMNRFSQYEPGIDETHHTQKLDAPSGTALVLGRDLLERLERKNRWELNAQSSPESLMIRAFREGTVPGTHVVRYESDTDTLELVHRAKSRRGFAGGAVLAAEFLSGKQGVYGMEDLLDTGKNGKA